MKLGLAGVTLFSLSACKLEKTAENVRGNSPSELHAQRKVTKLNKSLLPSTPKFSRDIAPDTGGVERRCLEILRAQLSKNLQLRDIETSQLIESIASLQKYNIQTVYQVYLGILNEYENYPNNLEETNLFTNLEAYALLLKNFEDTYTEFGKGQPLTYQPKKIAEVLYSLVEDEKGLTGSVEQRVSKMSGIIFGKFNKSFISDTFISIGLNTATHLSDLPLIRLQSFANFLSMLMSADNNRQKEKNFVGDETIRIALANLQVIVNNYIQQKIEKNTLRLQLDLTVSSNETEQYKGHAREEMNSFLAINSTHTYTEVICATEVILNMKEKNSAELDVRFYLQSRDGKTHLSSSSSKPGFDSSTVIPVEGRVETGLDLSYEKSLDQNPGVDVIANETSIKAILHPGSPFKVVKCE